MKTFISLFLITISLCTFGQEGFEKGKQGLLYKIIPGTSNSSLIKIGDIVQHSQFVLFGDSIVQNTEESGNQFVKIDSADQPFSTTEVLKKMKLGDSAVIRLSCDSIYTIQSEMAKSQGVTQEQVDAQMPKFITTKGNFIDIYISVKKQYENDSLAMIDFEIAKVKMQAYQQKMQEKMMAEQAKKDKPAFANCEKDLAKFLGAKLKTMKKTKSGAYVQILKQGTGPLCVKGKTAQLRYKGMLLNGFIFDTNIKKPGEEAKPLLDVVVLAGGMIKGFDEGVALLRKGTKAKIYMPCGIAYGAQPPGADIPPYANMVFEVEVVNVK